MKKPTHHIFTDILTHFDTPLIDTSSFPPKCIQPLDTSLDTPLDTSLDTPLRENTCLDAPSKKKVVVKKDKVLKDTNTIQEQGPTRKLSTYNVFIKEKRQALLVQYPKLSKAEIYDMAKQAYREIKSS